VCVCVCVCVYKALYMYMCIYIKTAVNAEEFEKAQNISETLKHVQAQKMLHLLQVCA